MGENKLISLSKGFAIDIINLSSEIKENKKSNILLNQLLRCGTSIGANIYEANYAASRADFINKLHISLKECYETDYWLTIFRDTGIISEVQFTGIYEKCCKIRKLLISSLNTAKRNN